jgi:ADP-heptose:LPS heptosyltransferase
LFISLVAWHSASLAYLSHALHADVTIGYDQSFDIALPRLYTKHTADLMFDAVRVIDSQLQLHDFLVVPTYASRARTAAETIKQTLHGMKLLAVHTETTAAKTWKPESWTKVLDEFLGARDEYIAILVDYERRLPQLSGASADGRVIDASGLPLEGALCLVQHSNLFVGVDSCMLHAADFGGVPSVGLFISTSAKEFGFLMAPHVAIEAQSADAIDCRRVTSAMAALAVNPSQRSTIFA